ncbi:HAD family hydrolase [Flavobacterium caeni]|uniref:Putative hydrolase of the HAD superfamily n=1 Tax=Flavobacterium caeni TaxID=490189 RepID=A0A1G5FKF3_9FLAO|nr:HAD family hydrolase [Flavobacterium caeni]SCY39330.1 putative hydrolase of the HAD superfamily [Flavobacterium caeni]
MEKKTIVFDLDDTLVKEIDYLKSAFAEIAAHLDPENDGLFGEMFGWYQDKQDVFGNLEKRYAHAVKAELKDLYRNHFPKFDPLSASRDLLIKLKNDGHYLGLVTDGFSVTQRNKIRALDIEHLFDLIVISEEFGSAKPDRRNFEIFAQFETAEYFYISDNIAKDFVAPNALGWTTVCLLDDGQNIHKQDFEKEVLYLPATKIHALTELIDILNQK